MSEKDKNCVEFSIHSMTVSHRPYQEDADIVITGKSLGREVVMVPKREFERLQTENEQLKQKLNEFDPLPEFRELLKKLYSTGDVEKLEWVLNHTCGGRGSVNGWIAVSLFWKQKYENLSKLVGFSSEEEIEDYLVNEAKCDTLHEAIHLMCKEMDRRQKKIDELRDDISGRSTVIEHYKRDIEKWQEATGCETPDKAMEYLSKLKNEGTHVIYFNDPLGIIAKWEKVTGYDRPEDFLKWKANIEGSVEAWKRGTGCKYPAEARILLEKWKTLTKCETPEAATTWITSYESACERGNRLAKEIEDWQKATGCNSPIQAISRIEGLENAVRLTDKTLIGELERTIEEWQKATGRIDPEAAKQYIDRLTARLNKIHEYSVDW